MRLSLLLATATLPAAAVGPPFRPTALFGHHMVLQATDPDKPDESAHIAGLAPAGEIVTLEVAFGGKTENTFRTASDSSGRWSIGGLKATMNQGPFVLTLSSMGESHTASDVWFGTVLLCTGQSNMELNLHPIYNNDSIIAGANTPEIRLFQVPINVSVQPLPVGTPLGANWTMASPATVPGFSAICYLTAREISDRMMCEAGACHFGLIQSCLGSTDVQSWMSAEAREHARTSCWAEHGQPTPAVLPPSESHAPKGNISGEPMGSASLLYNAMIAPLIGYQLSGVLW